MTEKPILFSGPMVRAILDGRKTMTRRTHRIEADRLWVRETWSYDEPQVIYRADYNGDVPPEGKWRPSIFMPRKFSRITLEATGVRVERLQEITEEDAIGEGVFDGGCLNCGGTQPCGCDNPVPDARDSFIWIWDSLNGKTYPWASNPFVWVIEFRRVPFTTA